MLHLCTYFDANYLLRGLTLYRSLISTEPHFTLYILCLDTTTYNNLSMLNLPNIVTYSLKDIETWYPELLNAKKNRSRIEYYFTLTPSLPLFILDKHKGVNLITYIDSDLYFFESPHILLDEIHGKSILVTEHRFPDYLKEKQKYGRFNVQFESFRRDSQGLECLHRWQQQCIEWCYDYLDGHRFADQKYLDEWPTRYDRLSILKHPGGGVAPWNWATYPISMINNNLYINKQPIIFYHFHGVKILHTCFISNGLFDFGSMPRKFRNYLYITYINEIKNTQKWLNQAGLKIDSIADRYRHRNPLKGKRAILEIIKKIPSQIMFTCNI